MQIGCRVYRPRRARESPLYRLLERHIEELFRVWPERFTKRHGRCARWSSACCVPSSIVACRNEASRGFGAPSAGAVCWWRFPAAVVVGARRAKKKKQLLWAEWLRNEMLAPVPHRHVVLTMPRLLRPLFRRRRELLTELARAGAEAVSELMRLRLGADLRPGIAVSIATAGDLLQWHPHGHILVSDGGFAPDGSFRPLPEWDATLLMQLFRERLLARLLDKHAISHELVGKLMAWRHPGFSAHVGEPIAPDQHKRLADLAAYLVKSPVSLKKLVYLDGRQAVLYRSSKMNPGLGRNFEALDPLEWLARLSDHIPDPRQHRTIAYGHYANRARGARHKPADAETHADHQRRTCSPSWARLIAKVYEVDPLTCSRCGKQMKLVACVTDPLAVRRILEHLGLSAPEKPRPPPIREITTVPVDDDGRELVAP